jgi:hypothetical protein
LRSRTRWRVRPALLGRSGDPNGLSYLQVVDVVIERNAENPEDP